MKYNNEHELWWDHSLLLEHFATILLDSAHRYRTDGRSIDRESTAKQIEDCAWAMLSVDFEVGKEQEQVDIFCEIMRKNILGWWD